MERAIEAWSAALGEERCVCESGVLARYARSTRKAAHAPKCVLYPQSTQEVQAVVRVAAEHQLPLYPLSRGCNWGYGDAAPLSDGAAVVDLSRMNRILEINRSLAYVVIESGVSQAQLYHALRQEAPELWLDSTGAGLNASIAGNVLERGFGHTPYGDHSRTAAVLEAVAGDGSLVQPGFARFSPSRAQHVFHQGVGPSLSELFSQSNFGIVTRMVLWLYPRPEAFRCFYLVIEEEEGLYPLLEALRPLRLRGVLNSAVHIGNDLRVLASDGGYPWERTGGKTPLSQELRKELRRELTAGSWNLTASLSGTRAQVRGASSQVRRTLKPLGRLVFLDDAKLRLAQRTQAVLARFNLARNLGRKLEVLAPNYGLLKGIPTDAPIQGVYWRLRDRPEPLPSNPLETSCGLYWLSPVLPLTGEDARRMLGLIRPIFRQFEFDELLTFTLLNERSMVAVLNISYDQAVEGEANLADACYDAAMDALMEAGYVPYRSGPRSMHRLGGGQANVDLFRRLKASFDPRGIIAPGRYVPPEEPL